MTFLTRIRPPAVSAPSRRAYSSFFSSGAGGGRHFTTTKLPRPVVAGPANKRSPAPKPSPASSTKAAAADSSDNKDGAKSGASNVQTSSSGGLLNNNVKEDSASNSSPSIDNSQASSPSPTPRTVLTSTPAFSNSSLFTSPETYYHPTVDTKDFKLLQFFSSHRPLLLLNHPSDLFVSRPFSQKGEVSFSRPSPLEELRAVGAPPAPPNATIDDAHEADAEAARQLSRALTMSHAGSAMVWEETLRKLGIDVNKDQDRIGLQEKLDKDWEDVMMDSVKRKRKKKMKKHKLKKRRKLTRASRLKLGR